MEKNLDRSGEDIIIDSSRPMLRESSPFVQFERDENYEIAFPSINDQIQNSSPKPEFESISFKKPSSQQNQVHPQPTENQIDQEDGVGKKTVKDKGDDREEMKAESFKPLSENQQKKIPQLVKESTFDKDLRNNLRQHKEEINAYPEQKNKPKSIRNQNISQSKVDFSPNVLSQPYPSPSTQIGVHQLSQQQVDENKKVSSRRSGTNQKIGSSRSLRSTKKQQIKDDLQLKKPIIAMQPQFDLPTVAKQPNYDSNSEILQEFASLKPSEVDAPSTEPFQRPQEQDKVALLAEMNIIKKEPTFNKDSESPLEKAKTKLTKVQKFVGTVMDFKSEIESRYGAITMKNMIKDELIEAINQKKIDLESAAAQKRDYIKKYGIEFEIPSLYVQNSVIYKKDPQYSVQVVNYVVPESSDYIVKCHDRDSKSEQELEQSTFKNIYSEIIDGYALRFIKSDKYLRTIEIESEKIFQRTTASGKAVQIVKIYFSEDQKYFFMWLDLIDELEIYAVDSFEQLQDDIEQQKYLIKIDQGLSFVKRIEFDRNGRFFYALNDRKLAIFNLEKLIKDPKSHRPIEYELKEKYEMIYDVNLTSVSDSEFDCLVVAKLFNQKKFHIFNIENELMRNSINFFDEVSDKLTVKLISKENTFKAIVINGKEKFQICGEQGSNLQMIRKNLPQLGNKNVISITRNFETDENQEENYYVLACDTFDNRYHIYNTQDELYHKYIDTKTPTDQMHVFDLQVDGDKGLHIHSMLDGEFILDKIDQQPEDDKKYSNVQTLTGSCCIGWPYICFSGFKNRLMIINLFERKTLHRVQVARGDEKTQVCKTFITSTKDLFVVILNQNRYVLYMLDLDTCNNLEMEEGLNQTDRFKFQKIFEYSAEEVNFNTLDDIFVRGSSRKELIQLNNKLVVFLLHGNQLFTWSESKKGEEINQLKVVNNIEENLIIQSKLCIQDDQNFLFCQKSTHLEDSISSICQISLKYNDFEKNIICREDSPKFDFIKFNLDRENNVLILILQIKEKEKQYVKIYDFDEEKMIYESILSNQEPKLRELLTSGAYTLVDGHMYFNNNVFKIRYDLMKKYQSRQLAQNQFFNEYNNILELKENQQVKLDCPFVSIQGHKFMYIAFNPYSFEPKTIKVLPYLHERKIYLNPIKPNNSYFYTSIQKEFGLDRFDQPVDLASKVKQKVAQSLIRAQKRQGDSQKTTFIMAVNLTEFKYYVYSERGLLVNRINFGQFIRQYGEPLTVSSNGLNYIFKIKGENTVNIVHMNEFKAHFLKSIDVKQAFWQCLNEQQKQTQSEIRINCSWVEKDRYDFDVQINNANDVFIEFRESENNPFDDFSSQTHLETQGLSSSSFRRKSSRIKDNGKVKINAAYYYQAGWFNDKDPVGCKTRLNIRPDQDMPVGHSILISKEYGPQKSKFKLSEENVFFWTQFQIRQYPLIQSMFPHESNLLSFQIDPKQNKSSIRNIDISPFLEQMAIIVDHQEGYSTIVCWNITKNYESQGFEVDRNHLVIWDHQGYLVIINKGNTILQAQECSLKCFQIDNFETNKLTVFNENLDYDQGCRFDGQSHNWCILREYLCLPFSYMTFIIKEYLESLNGDVEEEPLLNTAFDLEPYNYIQNKTSSFLSGDLVKNNHQELKLVLQNFERIDPEYLEILHYNHPNKVQKFQSDEDKSTFEQLKDNLLGDNKMQRSSCLHYAYIEGNNRSLDILLTYLAKIKRNCSRSFMDILPLLVEQQSFYTYFENLQFQSRQMDDKHILRLQDPFSDDIVAMAASRSIYLDDNFYNKSMGEQKSNIDFKSYPVNVQCLRIGWIIYEPEGVDLLQAIYSNDRIEQYEMAPLHIIIEYLFSKNKKIVLWTLFPLYIIQGMLFFFTIELSELASIENAQANIERWRHVIAIFNQVFTTLMVCIMFKTFTIMGWKFFKRVYTWIDLIFYCLNTYMCISCLYHLMTDTDNQEDINEQLKNQRISGSIAVCFFLLKSFYYMKLIDAIAPLIDIIIRIMKDIIWFMVIFTISLVCIGISYYLLGRNQIDFDSTCKADSCDNPDLIFITEDDIPYSTLGGAFWFMWSIVITGGELDAFELGEASQIPYLKVLYIVSSFCIIIHMSNMLIAIMGETFATNNEVAHYVKIRDHLSFVLDNWFLNDIYLLTEPEKMYYIIVASGVQAQDANQEHLENIENSLQVQNEEISKLNKDINIIMNKQLEHETMMMNVLKNQNKMLQSQQ